MPGLLTRVKSKLFIFAHRRTLRLLDGEYGSVFHGRSLDFDELRSYVPGDDVRDIDWKATARHGSPLVKRYVAVRRQNVLLLADTGRNMAAVSASGESKREVLLQAMGVVGYLAQRHGDDIALVHGTAASSTAGRAASGEEHLERILRDVDSAVGLGAAPGNVNHQLEFVLRNVKQRMLLVVFADEFMPDAGTERLLRRLRVRHEVLWFTIRDAVLAGQPEGMPADGDIDVVAGLKIPGMIAMGAEVRAAYASAMQEREEVRRRFYRRLGIAEGQAAGSGDVLPAVFSLLERHRAQTQQGSRHAV